MHIGISLLILFVLLLSVVQISKVHKQKEVHSYLAKFEEWPECATYAEAQPRLSLGSKKQKVEHAVLLLHGFSDTPYSFQYLLPYLEKAKFPYYAPLITGFGLNHLNMLKHVEAADWLRDALQAYDLLASMAHKVSIVGHSNGAALATYIAQHREVEQLILTGPNLIVGQEDRIYKQILNIPLLAHLVLILIPIVRKPQRADRVTNIDTLDPASAREVFHYPAIPTHSLKVLWEIQDLVEIQHAKMKQLTLMYGEHDRSVDIPGLLNRLDEQAVPYQAFSFPNSAHNVLEDYEREEACRLVTEILTSSREK